ncbi:MAG TPA: membrane-bound PQQ-dependent dehydrogenase, glucose/quinate/shikimate family [Gammaproteobacteria bacterium]
MKHRNDDSPGWPLLIFGALVALLGLVLAAGGAWLMALGGSWYYLLAGIGLLVAGIQLARGRFSGAWWFGAVFIGTLLWTAWEAGLDYWRWIPRFGLMVVLAIVVALLLPRLSDRDGSRHFSRTVSWSLAGVLALIFLGVFALAFVPPGVTGAGWRAANATPGAASDSPTFSDTKGTFIQPAVAPVDSDWPAYGRSNGARRYSPLSQINSGNVAKLERVWTYRTGDIPEKRWGAETTPLKVDDTLYLCSATNTLIALDAASGKERWRHEVEIPQENIPYTAACRSVAYYEFPPVETPGEGVAGVVAHGVPQPCSPRIIEGTLDGRLIAVDALTGERCENFGDNGEVDITRGMGEVLPGMVSITSPPVIVRGVIVTGHQVLDGQRRWAPSGVIQGFDVMTGERLWAWDMMHPEWDNDPPEGETFARGTPNMWTIASADEELGYVYLPMGNSAVDYWSSLRRPPENEFSTSLVAIDVATGKPAWHFQTVHKDVWDYDLGSTGSLVDFPTGNGAVPAIVLSSKQGDIYVLDRRTGEPLTGVEERPVPQGGVEPDERTPTQPFSLYHTLAKRDLTEKDMWGLTPLDQLWCRIQFQRASYEGIYTPPTVEQHWIEYPGYNGGSDWGGIAIDPKRGVIVANYNDMPNHNKLVPREKAEEMGWAPRSEARGEPGGAEGAGDPQAGTPFAIDVNAGWRLDFTGMLCKEPPYGGIRVIDLASGKTIWDRPFGTARSNGPFGIPSQLPFIIGTPNNGGPVVTAGGIIFIAASTDNLIRAIDLETGEKIWEDELPAGGQATPMTYSVDGRQYLVIMAGGHHFMETPAGDYVIAYALPD